MTVKEALSTLVGVPVESNVIDLALLDNGLTGSETYVTETHKLVVDNALIDVLLGVFMLSSQSEGDGSISYNFEGIKQRLLFLATKYGRVDVLDYLKPTVNSRPVW